MYVVAATRILSRSNGALTQSIPVMRAPLGGSVDWRATGGHSSRPITTFAEARPDPRTETPVTPYMPLLRTSYDGFQDFVRKNESYKNQIVLLPKTVQLVFGVTYFTIGGTLWAAGGDATNPNMIYDTVKMGAKILNVTVEQLADVACVKNLNHPSNERQDNIQLHSDVISALREVKSDRNPEVFTSLEVTSNAKNPKFTREDLLSVVKGQGLSCEVINEKIQVVSVDNAGSRELAHDSSTVRVNLDATPVPNTRE